MHLPQHAIEDAIVECNLQDRLQSHVSENQGHYTITLQPKPGMPLVDGLQRLELTVSDAWGRVAVVPAVTRDIRDPEHRNDEQRLHLRRLLGSFFYHLYR